MRINNTGIDFHRTDLAKGVQGGDGGAGKKQPVQPVAPVQRGGDSVQISDAGRALAAQRSEGAEARPGLSAERIGEIRQRILQGAYNSTEVVDEVARRMLERGDI